MIGNDATAWAHLDHHGAARECGCTPQEAGGRRLAHTRVTIKGRRGGSLPALVAGIPTAPLAHTIHSTSRAVPPAVVSVVGIPTAPSNGHPVRPARWWSLHSLPLPLNAA